MTCQSDIQGAAPWQSSIFLGVMKQLVTAGISEVKPGNKEDRDLSKKPKQLLKTFLRAVYKTAKKTINTYSAANPLFFFFFLSPQNI